MHPVKRHRKMQPEERQALVEVVVILYKLGMSLPALHRETGRSLGWLHKITTEAGVTRALGTNQYPCSHIRAKMITGEWKDSWRIIRCQRCKMEV